MARPPPPSSEGFVGEGLDDRRVPGGIAAPGSAGGLRGGRGRPPAVGGGSIGDDGTPVGRNAIGFYVSAFRIFSRRDSGVSQRGPPIRDFFVSVWGLHKQDSHAMMTYVFLGCMTALAKQLKFPVEKRGRQE